MIKMQLPDNLKDSGLAMPDSTPKTLIEVDSENLPYACQCPLCGGLFNIPEGLLYKIEEDSLKDADFGAEVTAKGGTDIDIDTGGGFDESIGSSSTQTSSTSYSNTGVGEADDTSI
jgi:hypothetical protein